MSAPPAPALPLQSSFRGRERERDDFRASLSSHDLPCPGLLYLTAVEKIPQYCITSVNEKLFVRFWMQETVWISRQCIWSDSQTNSSIYYPSTILCSPSSFGWNCRVVRREKEALNSAPAVLRRVNKHFNCRTQWYTTIKENFAFKC